MPGVARSRQSDGAKG